MLENVNSIQNAKETFSAAAMLYALGLLIGRARCGAYRSFTHQG
jgi:hypothetical protein